MSDFRIQFNWEDPLGARGAALRAAWASLEIRVRNTPVTRVYDDRVKTMRDRVYLPLCPLAEWLAANWWCLWNEPGPSAHRPNYEDRHSLVGAREGYALPPLRIQPAGSTVLLQIAPEQMHFHGLEFHAQRNLWVETEAVKNEFATLMDAVAGRLESQGVTDTLVQRDWEAIRRSDEEEIQFCECAGALGLDPYSLDEGLQDQIERAGNQLPDEVVREFFQAARPKSFIEEADAVGNVLSEALTDASHPRVLQELARTIANWHEPEEAQPWRQGYSIARRLRSHLGLDGKALKSIEEVAQAVGESGRISTRFNAFPRSMPFAAAMGITETSSPMFFLRTALPTSGLFHFSRALFEFLFSRPHRNALVTDADTERQKRNRAFAAEFLAPASAIENYLGGREVVTSEDVEELALEFGVSSYVIDHQLRNHDIAAVDEQ